MKKVKSKHITLSILLLTGFVLLCFLAAYHWFFPVLGLCCLLGYYLVDKKFLRCPYCGGFTNLANLSYAKKHEFHCLHCGKIIQIDTEK